MRNGACVLLPQRRPCPSAGGIYSADSPDTAEGALTEQTGDSSMRIPAEFPVPHHRDVAGTREIGGTTIARHMMTHVPYATWCQDCGARKTVEAAHRRLRREPAAASIISADYCFLGLTDKPEAERKEGDPDCVTVLVIVDSVSMCQRIR